MFKSCNIDNIHYELYISMTIGMQPFIVREIQLFKVKLKKISLIIFKIKGAVRF